MKTNYKLNLVLLVTITLTVFACGEKTDGNGNGGQNQQPAFATPEEAVENAKKDFLEILKTGQDFNLGVDAATLERAEAGELLRYMDLDFAKIMQADSTTTFDQLTSSERTSIVPMAVDGNVATIVELTQDDKGWRVAGLAGTETTNELNVVYNAISDTVSNTITVYEIPNLNGKIYGVNNGSEDLYYTNYGDKFSLRQGVTAQVLLAVLREDAIIFQREYGDLIKGKGLLK